MDDKLRDVSFLSCSKQCPIFRHMGKKQCIDECPWKFDGRGNPINLKKERDNESKVC